MENFQQSLTAPAINGTSGTELTAKHFINAKLANPYYK